MKRLIKRAKQRLASFLRYLADKLHKESPTRDSVRRDARTLKRGAVVLFNYKEQMFFVFGFMKQESLMKDRELVKFTKRGEKRLRVLGW